MKVSKLSLQRWKAHCTKVQELTVLNGFESEAEKAERIERAKLDYEFFVSYYLPHYAKSKCGKFQIDAANEVHYVPHVLDGHSVVDPWRYPQPVRGVE